MYGRTSQRICNHDLTGRTFEKTCANIEQSKYQTKLRCQDKSTCQMLIDNQIFTDPCGSTIPKHFEVHYRCIDKEQICSKLFANCSKSRDIRCIQRIQEDFSCSCPSNICRYNNQQIIGFVENVCLEEHLQGFHWVKTPINTSQSRSCPSPCHGKISRFCQSNHQWSKANYTNCECPIKQSDQLSTHRQANGYVFQCNFWLINRLLPKENLCILSFVNWNEPTNDDENSQSFDCLLSAFKRMTFSSCLGTSSFGIDFQNLIFEIHFPKFNQSQIHFLANNYDRESNIPFNRILLDRTDIIKEHSHANLPMMVIDTKNQSVILIEQGNDFNLVQTGNVTVMFRRPPSDSYYYQCRAYRSTNFSFEFDSTNMFFACQSMCSNASHVICQCPFFNPFMHYHLHIDKSRARNDFNDECLDEINQSIDENLNRIDRYLKNISSVQSAKKLLAFIDKLVEREYNWNVTYRMIKQMEYLGLKILRLSKSFTSIHSHLEFSIDSKKTRFQNSDQFVSISFPTEKILDVKFQLIFFTIQTNLLNSQLVTVYSSPKGQVNGDIQIEFRHLNASDRIPTCAYLKTFENVVQWATDGCQLVSTNSTHSICLCNHLSTFALLTNFEKSISKWTRNQTLSISKLGCIISILCLLLTIILLIIIRSRTNVDDDLTTVRSILHTNMLLCLIIVQILFLFGIDQTRYKFGCRIISILLDYFLLASISWMFVDGIELLIALKHVFKIDRIRLIAYSLYSYGFPLLIVFLSISLSAKLDNESNQYCWLSHDNSFIWAFAIPFILLILANLCFLMISIYSICSKLKPSEYISEIRSSLRDMSIISILFGLTWIIALVYLYSQTISFAYIFTLLNSLHGLLIFIFYGLIQKHIQNSFGKFCCWNKSHSSWLRCFMKSNGNSNHLHTKSLEHFSLPDNTSSSGYSSAHSSDLNNKQLLCNQNLDYSTHLSRPISFHNQYNRRSCLVHETSYLPSIPNNLLPNRLSTFRYQLPANETNISHEQNEQLLQKTQIHDEDHQYYEIG
ncbi:unnamed protein product [Adineta ricciae]|uniref:Uncharacterized protein n=3 Tax=Adineta ricciae TaxID=249248 RepID=A0A815B4A4_ADIRI|nr:unnamed protein product [Adineta ricciae]